MIHVATMLFSIRLLIYFLTLIMILLKIALGLVFSSDGALAVEFHGSQ